MIDARDRFLKVEDSVFSVEDLLVEIEGWADGPERAHALLSAHRTRVSLLQVRGFFQAHAERERRAEEHRERVALAERVHHLEEALAGLERAQWGDPRTS